MQVGELFFKLGVQGSNVGLISQFDSGIKKLSQSSPVVANANKKVEAGLKTLQERFKSIIGPMNMARLQIIAVGAALTAITKKTSDAAANLVRFHNVTGLSTRGLQEWQQKAAMSGVSAEEFQGAIEDLQAAAVEVSFGRGNLAPWQVLGIDYRQNPLVWLNQLTDRLNRFPTPIGTKFARDLNLSDKFISFLKELKSLPQTDKSLLLSDKEIAKLKLFNILFNQVWDTVKRTLQKFGVLALPVAEAITRAMNSMARSFIQGVQGAENIAGKFKAIAPFFTAIGVALAVIFFPVTSALIGIALVLDDIAAYVRGDDSVLGDIVKWFKKWKEESQGLLASLLHIIPIFWILDKLTGGKASKFVAEGMTDFVKRMLGQHPELKNAADALKYAEAKNKEAFGGNTPETAGFAGIVNSVMDLAFPKSDARNPDITINQTNNITGVQNAEDAGNVIAGKTLRALPISEGKKNNLSE